VDLQWIWYALIGVLFIGYAILDGFDLGIGVLYPFLPRSDGERSVLRSAIGPIWDGNEVWLITAGGALFAAFPAAYALAFGGFYLAIMLVLFGLILRAVSLEFRHRDEKWTRVWDLGFFVGSLLPALLLGCAVGNLIRGVPMAVIAPRVPGAGLDYTGSFLDLLNPYSLLCGVLGLSMFVLQGASWAALKSEGALRERAAKARSYAQIAFAVLVVATTIATVFAARHHVHNVLTRPFGWVAIAVLAAGLAAALFVTRRRNDFGAFAASSLATAGLVLLWGAGNYPSLVVDRHGGTTGAGLTVETSSSSLTLKVMLLIAVVFVPLVLGYTAFVYKTFRGRVGSENSEY
jgi:cytochrome bd ubiquinol oxidase subunit II